MAVRSGPVFGSTVNFTRAGPVPAVLPGDSDIHDASAEAVHAQPASVSSSNSMAEPDAGTVALDGSRLNVQPWPWFTVNVRPAMVSVPERDGPVVDAATNRTVPLPLPDSPDEIVSQGALLAAVHAQPSGAVTATVPLPPDAGSDSVSGAIAKEQPWDCVTVTVCPATVSVPLRDGPVVAATVNVTVPSAVPDVEPGIEIHGTTVDAVQAHPFPAVTVTVPEPPPAPNECDAGTTTYAHDAGGGGGGVGGGLDTFGGWVTENTWPATTSVPVRGTWMPGATENVTAPDPVPLEPEAMLIQSALLAAVHGHAGMVVTAIVPLPPAPGALWLVGAIE